MVGVEVGDGGLTGGCADWGCGVLTHTTKTKNRLAATTRMIFLVKLFILSQPP